MTTRRPARIPRSNEDLLQQFEEQKAFLRRSAATYDGGDPTESKRLAVHLRILLHDGQGRSLLSQLGMLDQVFRSHAVPWNSANVAGHTGLVKLDLRPGRDHWLPLLDLGSGRPLPFMEWWNEVVVCDQHRDTLTRRDLVLSMCDTDGGAHVDPGLEEKYERVSRRNSVGWMVRSSSGDRPVRGVHSASVRQIAHEVLRTLRDSEYRPDPDALGGVFGIEAYDNPPPDIEPLIQAKEWAKTTGRNDPCPCGLGRKFKKCHGKGL